MSPRITIAAIAIALLTRTASGQGTDVYKTAVKLETAGALVDALAKFESIPPEKRDYNTKLHIAGCKKKLGRLLEAERDYEAIRSDPKADPATVETAASDLEDLRPRIPKLRIKVSQATTGVVIHVDGRESATGSIVLVNPGSHTVTARRAESEVFRRELNVAEGTSVDVEVDVPAPPPSAAPLPAPKPLSNSTAPAARSDAAPDSRLRTIGFVAAGFGVVATAGGVYLATRASNLEQEGKELGARGDLAAGSDRISAARDAQTMARIGLGVGVAGLIGGALIVALTPSGSSKANSASRRPLTLTGSVGSTWALGLAGEF